MILIQLQRLGPKFKEPRIEHRESDGAITTKILTLDLNFLLKYNPVGIHALRNFKFDEFLLLKLSLARFRFNPCEKTLAKAVCWQLSKVT